MQQVIQLAAAAAGSFGFAALFNIRGEKLAIATFGGFFSWGVYLFSGIFTQNAYFCGFAASVMLTLYAEGMARIHKTPVTVFLVSAAIPLIPGAALYRSMNVLLQRRWEVCLKECIYTLLFAISMSAGITVTTLIFRTIWKTVYRQRRF